EKNNSVIIQNLPKRQMTSLADLKRQFADLGNNPSDKSLQNFGRSLTDLVGNFSSPALGIGNEAMKQDLKNIDRDLTEAGNLPIAQRQQEYGRALNQLQVITDELDQPEEHIRLGKLRSVRNYKEALDESGKINTRLEDNQAQLE